MKKTIVLTGGSKGMGKSTLLKFAENNFDYLMDLLFRVLIHSFPSYF